MIQKQSVTAEDMFLGASEKDPSSAHCDQVVVKVHLPGEVSADLDLDVTRQRIVVQGKHQCVAGAVGRCCLVSCRTHLHLSPLQQTGHIPALPSPAQARLCQVGGGQGHPGGDPARHQA